MWWEKDKKVEPHTTQIRHPADSLGVKAAASPPDAPRSELPVNLYHLNEGLENHMTEATLKASTLVASNPRQTLLGSSVVLKGELSADEDLTIEGQFDGSINLKDNCLTIGQHGQVKADINARQVVISGKLSGKVNARDKVEIHKTGNVVGDLITMGVAIEEGAYFKGSIEILREEENVQARAAVSAWSA
jgi:cytoskeletal protein CcmA (bactofilin family)